MRELTPINQQEYRALEEKERRRHRQAIKRLDERRQLFQSTCPHKHTGFVPDPSGNNDSYYECNVCGKIL